MSWPRKSLIWPSTPDWTALRNRAKGVSERREGEKWNGGKREELLGLLCEGRVHRHFLRRAQLGSDFGEHRLVRLALLAERFDERVELCDKEGVSDEKKHFLGGRRTRLALGRSLGEVLEPLDLELLGLELRLLLLRQAAILLFLLLLLGLLLRLLLLDVLHRLEDLEHAIWK